MMVRRSLTALVHSLMLLPSLFVVACEGGGPPVKTASGEQIDHVEIKETFATSDEVKEVTLRGDRLREAVPLMEKHGVMDVKSGTFEAKGVLARGSVTLTIKPATGAERKIVVKDCAQENVCPFLDAAAAKGLIEHRVVACKTEATCAK